MSTKQQPLPEPVEGSTKQQPPPDPLPELVEGSTKQQPPPDPLPELVEGTAEQQPAQPPVDDPLVNQWLQRSKRGAKRFRRPDNPRALDRLRFQWWGWREGLKLYFFNHIVSRLPSHTVRLFFYRRIMEIGRRTSILLGLQLYYPGRLKIGRNSSIGAGCTLDSRAGIKIGNSVSIGPGVQIWSGGHDINSPDFVSYGGVTVIEDYVWIAASAIVLGGPSGPLLTLGEGCVVTAGSVVMRDVAPYTVVAGNPARKIAVRTRELNYKLDFFPPLR